MISLDKSILIQYCDLQEEIKDLQRRLERLEDGRIVSDTVKGTRKDGTYGSIKITGYSFKGSEKKEVKINMYRCLLNASHDRLLEHLCQAEEFIETIKKSEMRTMLRLYCIDGLSWVKLAQCMNDTYPEKRIPYTDESCRKRIRRFFDKV